MLEAGFDMPPLMLTADEIEAVVLGAQWVTGLADPLLAVAARDVVAKIAAVTPKPLLPFLVGPAVATKPADGPRTPGIDLRPLRSAIRAGRKLGLRYRAEAGDITERTVWPVVLGYAEARTLLIAWCELRQGFRHFRTDRILSAAVLDDAYAGRCSDLRRRWERWRDAERQRTAELAA